MNNTNLLKALFSVQGVIRGVKKDSKNPHFKNTYASLEAVTDTIREPMQAAGLLWYQTPGSIRDNSIEVTTVIAHADSGESITCTMEMPMAKRDPQGAGSSLTYAMRYSLMAILGLPPTDDDAEIAIDREDLRPSTPVKSSASLKKAGSWEQIMTELSVDIVDVRSLVSFEKLKDIYRERARAEGWTRTWMEQLGEVFEGHKKDILATTEQRELSTLEAG